MQVVFVGEHVDAKVESLIHSSYNGRSARIVDTSNSHGRLSTYTARRGCRDIDAGKSRDRHGKQRSGYQLEELHLERLEEAND